MDWKRFDAVRAEVGAVELDLIENFAAGKVSRRMFLKRGAILGIGASTMGAVLAACGGNTLEIAQVPTPTPNPTAIPTPTSAPTATPEPTPTPEPTATPEPEPSPEPTPEPTGTLFLGMQRPSAFEGLDPVNMFDPGTYNLVAHSLDYLVGVDGVGGIDPASGLAASWSPNDTADEWTFQLRSGVLWMEGNPLVAGDVAATLDRVINNDFTGLDFVIDDIRTPDDETVIITLQQPDAGFPVLLSANNPQTAITPADYSSGTTLVDRPNGTGPWMLDTYDEDDGATYISNPEWWRGKTGFDELRVQFYGTRNESVEALAVAEIDVVQQADSFSATRFGSQSDLAIINVPSAAHRQIWMNTLTGPMTDVRVRQALAWSIDREAMVDALYDGYATVANDSPVLANLPYFDEDAVPQRTRDVDQARALLTEAGFDRLAIEIRIGDLQEIPDLAERIRRDAEPAGFDITVVMQPNATFYGDSWCPNLGEDDGAPPCADSAPLGVVDWGHRPSPDIFLSSGLQTDGVWNASVYADQDYDGYLRDFRTALTVDDQRAAMANIQEKLWNDVPAIYPYFIDYLTMHNTGITGVGVTPLGHTFLGTTTRTG